MDDRKITLHRVCLLLGSNIEPEINIPTAIKLLRDRLVIHKISSVWQSASVDCCYPDYLNVAVVAETPLNAFELKEQVLRPLEASMGRVRVEDKNASRPIDFDIILFDDELHDPGLWQHAYQAVPVAELFPDMSSDSAQSLKQVANQLAQSTGIQKRDEFPYSRL